MVGVAPSSVAVNSIGARTIRKIQIRILPYILLLYIISFLDRINIGFAALTMNQELGITSQQFGMLVGMFSSVIPFLRSRATCSCTRSVLAFGLLVF
jgi:sugar phosphate permease